MGEVPASPETAPFNSGGPPELKPPTAPEPTMPIEMNIRMATETTTTGALSGVSDDKLVEPKLVLVDTRLPPGRVGQAEPAQQPQPPAQLDGQVPGQLGNKTRAWDLAKDSPDSTKSNSWGAPPLPREPRLDERATQMQPQVPEGNQAVLLNPLQTAPQNPFDAAVVGADFDLATAAPADDHVIPAAAADFPMTAAMMDSQAFEKGERRPCRPTPVFDFRNLGLTRHDGHGMPHALLEDALPGSGKGQLRPQKITHAVKMESVPASASATRRTAKNTAEARAKPTRAKPTLAPTKTDRSASSSTPPPPIDRELPSAYKRGLTLRVKADAANTQQAVAHAKAWQRQSGTSPAFVIRGGKARPIPDNDFHNDCHSASDNDSHNASDSAPANNVFHNGGVLDNVIHNGTECFLIPTSAPANNVFHNGGVLSATSYPPLPPPAGYLSAVRAELSHAAAIFPSPRSSAHSLSPASPAPKNTEPQREALEKLPQNSTAVEPRDEPLSHNQELAATATRLRKAEGENIASQRARAAADANRVRTRQDELLRQNTARRVAQRAERAAVCRRRYSREKGCKPIPCAVRGGSIEGQCRRTSLRCPRRGSDQASPIPRRKSGRDVAAHKAMGGDDGAI